MKTNTTTISLEQLATVTGGRGGGPLSGDNNQNIQTNWGGNQTNIGTQVINQAPKQPTSVVDFMRQNPGARLDAMRRQSTPLHR
jgi:hypothetical protein